MSVYLLGIGFGLVVVGYLVLFIDYLKYKGIDGKISSFDMAKDITNDYDHINVVLYRDTYFSYYYLKRNILRLSNRLYYATDLYSLAVVTYLSLVSLSHSKYLRWLGKVIPVVHFIPMFFLIVGVCSCFMSSKGDARIGIVIGLIVLIYQYFCLQIFHEGMSSSVKIKNKKNIFDILYRMYKVQMLFFVSTLVFLLRFVVILIF